MKVEYETEEVVLLVIRTGSISVAVHPLDCPTCCFRIQMVLDSGSASPERTCSVCGSVDGEIKAVR